MNGFGIAICFSAGVDNNWIRCPLIFLKDCRFWLPVFYDICCKLWQFTFCIILESYCFGWCFSIGIKLITRLLLSVLKPDSVKIIFYSAYTALCLFVLEWYSYTATSIFHRAPDRFLKPKSQFWLCAWMDIVPKIRKKSKSFFMCIVLISIYLLPGLNWVQLNLPL